MSKEVCLNSSLLDKPIHHIFMGSNLANAQQFSLSSQRLLNFHLVTARASTVASARGPVQPCDHSKHVLPLHAKKALVSKRFTSTRRHDSCSSGLLVLISVITTAMEIIWTSGLGLPVTRWALSYSQRASLLTEVSTMGLVLLIILIVLLLGGLPTWGYHSYDYGPSGIVGVLLIVIIVLLL